MNKSIIFVAILLAPFTVSAQTLQSFIAVVGNIAGLLLTIASTFALVAFFYGIAIFILNVSDEKKREEGKSILTWGAIALFVLVTIWGIIGLLQKTVGNTRDPGKVDIIVPTL